MAFETTILFRAKARDGLGEGEKPHSAAQASQKLWGGAHGLGHCPSLAALFMRLSGLLPLRLPCGGLGDQTIKGAAYGFVQHPLCFQYVPSYAFEFFCGDKTTYAP